MFIAKIHATVYRTSLQLEIDNYFNSIRQQIIPPLENIFSPHKLNMLTRSIRLFRVLFSELGEWMISKEKSRNEFLGKKVSKRMKKVAKFLDIHLDLELLYI